MQREHDSHDGKRGKHAARYGWEEAAQRMHELGEDKLLDEPTPTKWDLIDWKW